MRGEPSEARRQTYPFPHPFLKPVESASDHPSVDSRVHTRFALQEELFATLTLRAARNYVCYSATLRSYSGLVAILFQLFGGQSEQVPCHDQLLDLLGALEDVDDL